MAGLAYLGRMGGTIAMGAARGISQAYKGGSGWGRIAAEGAKGLASSEGARKTGAWGLKHLPGVASVRAAKSGAGVGAALKGEGKTIGELGKTGSLVALKGAKVGALLAGGTEFAREAGHLADPHAEHTPEHQQGIIHHLEGLAGEGVKKLDTALGSSRNADMARMAASGVTAAGALAATSKHLLPGRLGVGVSMAAGVAAALPMMRSAGRFVGGGGLSDPVGGVANATGLTRNQAAVAGGAIAAPIAGITLKKAPGAARAIGNAVAAVTRAPAAVRAAGAARSGAIAARQAPGFAKANEAFAAQHAQPAAPVPTGQAKGAIAAKRKGGTGEVKEHQRTLASGKTVTVKAHSRKPKPGAGAAA